MRASVLLLRIGLAFAFVYAAISGYMNPTAWVGFFPPFIQDLGSASLVVGVWGAIEIVLALIVLFKKDAFYPGILAAVLLFGVTFANWGAMDIVFRDISLGFAALALALLTKNRG